MAVSICRELPCSIWRVLIYYVRESDIRVNRYRHLNFSRSSVVQFWACQYIMVLIIHSSENLWPFEFAESFHVQFWGSRYIMGVDHTIESKVMAVWICWELPYSMSRVSIYDACESDIRVKRYCHLNFSRSSVSQFWASRYIVGLDHTYESKFMAVWICRELSCSISRVSIYNARESNIWVKRYSHLNFSRASVV